MNTPIVNFVKKYVDNNPIRFHMPGHKGQAFLGVEKYDITEVQGADELYAPEGIIAESEFNATQLFGTAKTLYSTEGSSQCIRAMMYLALKNADHRNGRPYVIAARNAHKAFIYSIAMLDLDVVWLWPKEMHSVCSCQLNADVLNNVLEIEIKNRQAPPVAVYITSPDYLGGMADIKTLAAICHEKKTILAVDNAHGAYLHFLREPIHPMDLGADICCDSAHKTLPVLTGGAYLHIHNNAPETVKKSSKQAMALFGSTSPSYLILQSLDVCNKYLKKEIKMHLEDAISCIDETKMQLKENGWRIENSDPLKLTILAPKDTGGYEISNLLRKHNIESEYTDEKYVVCMITPFNARNDLKCLIDALGRNMSSYADDTIFSIKACETGCTIRQAIFDKSERIPVEDALGRICGAPLVSCPPAIPIVVSGEIINEEAIKMLKYYKINYIEVL